MSKQEEVPPAMRTLRLFDTFSEPSYLVSYRILFLHIRFLSLLQIGPAPGADSAATTNKAKTNKAEVKQEKPFFPVPGTKHGHTDQELLQKHYVPLAATVCTIFFIYCTSRFVYSQKGATYINMEEYERKEKHEDAVKRNLAPFKPSNPSKKRFP